MKNKLLRILYSALSAMILTLILFSITENELVEKVGMFIIIFSCSLFFGSPREFKRNNKKEN